MKSVLCAAAFAASLQAGIVQPEAETFFFSDDFEYAGRTSQLNWTGGSNWGVTNGTVDLIGTPNPWGLACAGGSRGCVDLDGSTGDAGLLHTRRDLSMGGYELRFDHSGNQGSAIANANSLIVQAFDINTNLLFRKTF